MFHVGKLGLIVCIGLCAQAASAQQLVVVASGGAFEKALTDYFYDDYEAETGMDIVHVPATVSEQFARLRAMSEIGQVEWDVVTSTAFEDIVNNDLLEPLDCERIPNAKELGVPGTCGEYSLIRTIGATGVAYNVDVYGDNGPTNWVEFWDTETFPGTRCLYSWGPEGNVGIMMAALRADGVARDDLFPLDMKRALTKLDEIKDDIAQWQTTADQTMAGLRTGECDASMILSGRVIQMINAGEQVAFSWEDSIYVAGHWAIARGTQNLDEAYDFLNWFMTGPKRHLAFSTDMVYDTANIAALELVPEDQLPLRSSHAPNFANIIAPDYAWIAANLDAVRETFNAYLAQ